MGPDVLWTRGYGGRELFPLQWLHTLSLVEKNQEFGLMSGHPRRGLQLVWAHATYFRNGTSESLFKLNTGIPSSSHCRVMSLRAPAPGSLSEGPSEETRRARLGGKEHRCLGWHLPTNIMAKILCRHSVVESSFKF